MKFNNKLISNNYPTDYVLEAIKYAFEKKQLKRKLVGQIITNTIKYLNCIVNDNVKELQIIIAYITNLLNYDNIEDNNIRNNTVLDPVSQDIILKESIRVSIIIAIWIKIPLKSYLRKLIFLSGGGRQTESFFDIMVIQKCLEIGLSYNNHQELFDRILEKHNKSKELLFPRARYPSRSIRKMKSDISFLLSKGKQGHLYERTIPELVQMVIEYLDKETSGILPFFSKARSGHKEFLCALILKENEAYFYLKNTNKYYEFERSNNECN